MKPAGRRREEDMPKIIRLESTDLQSSAFLPAGRGCQTAPPPNPAPISVKSVLYATMPDPTSSPSRKPIRDDYRRVLRLLADSPKAPPSALLAHGFKLALLADVCRAGLRPRAQSACTRHAPDRVTRMRITDRAASADG